MNTVEIDRDKTKKSREKFCCDNDLLIETIL